MAPTTSFHHMVGARQGLLDPTNVPLAGLVTGMVLSMLSISVLSAFTVQRYLAVKNWRRLPFVQWLVFCIYSDSFLFVLGTAIIQFGFGVGYSGSICETAILLCLVFYVTTKLIYLFMVEKAYIIRSDRAKPRLKSKPYRFNAFGMIGVFCVIIVLNFVMRFARIENGECIIGLKRQAILPLIIFDLLVNVYLTILFLRPLYSIYAFKTYGRSPGSNRLKTMALRTFIGCVCTLTSSIVNLSVLVALNGEPGWVCLMCCNSDILFSAVVIHWITSRDNATDNGTVSTASSQNHGRKGGPGTSGGAVMGGGDELHVISPRSTTHYRAREDDENDLLDDDFDTFSMGSKTKQQTARSTTTMARV
ncbi:hypothetical protein VTJ49DRAFT_4432 [Mycothermus thermophilus]|uniref:Uncharacterized protein n=1 Tax=Humicola insolens TaxID=85995 RepID=A0ABR3V5D8_HUMIN